MRKIVAIILTLTISLYFVPAHVFANPSDKYVLQQYLTIVEVESDLDRVHTEQQKLEQNIEVNKGKLVSQEGIVSNLRKKGGNVLRAYYTGERISWINMVLSMETFHHGLLLIEYLFEIFNRDMTELESAYEAYQSLIRLQQEMDQQQLDLVMLKNHYMSQKERLQNLEKQLNTSLASIPEKERLQQLMKQLEQDWTNKGKPAFHMFFNQLAKAIEKFPDIIKRDNLSLKGTNPKVTLSDEELNAFLKKENALFRDLSFTFRDGEMWAQGVHDGAALTLVGSYALVSDQKLEFSVLQMTFDGFHLPDTTIKEMENTIDLGFYPTYIHPNIRVKDFTMKDHKLQLELKFSLK